MTIGLILGFGLFGGPGLAHAETGEATITPTTTPKTTPISTPAYTQIFKENIQAAVRNHPRVSAAIATRDSYRYQQREAESGFYPTLEVGVSGRTRLAQSFENRFDNITLRSLRNTSANANITGRQLIYDAGRISGRVASARHTFTAAHEEYSQIASAIALLAAENHFQIMLQRARRTLHQEDIRDHRDMLSKVSLRYKTGRGTERDVALVNSRLALAEAAASSAQIDLDQAISQYEENYGFPPETIKQPALALDLPETLALALETGLQNNPALSIVNALRQASKSGMDAEKAERLPSLSVELAAIKYDLERGNSDYDVTGRLVMNYSLYNGGARSARISRSIRDYDRARYDEATTLREVNRKIKVAFQTLQNHDTRLAAYHRASDASKKNADQLQEQYEATGGSLLALLEAKRDYYQAHEQWLEAVTEKNILQYRLLDQLGTLLPTLGIRLQKVEK